MHPYSYNETHKVPKMAEHNDDLDPVETREWLEALDGVIEY